MPDCSIDDMVISETSVLVLPGADTWNDPKHGAIIEKAGEFLSLGATVCAICGATTALASFGLLDHRPHTSNGPGFLEMFSPGYKGQSFYRQALCSRQQPDYCKFHRGLCRGRNKLSSIWVFLKPIL